MAISGEWAEGFSYEKWKLSGGFVGLNFHALSESDASSVLNHHIPHDDQTLVVEKKDSGPSDNASIAHVQLTSAKKKAIGSHR